MRNEEEVAEEEAGEGSSGQRTEGSVGGAGNETTNWKHWRTITREQYNRFVCHKSNFMIITAEARSYSAGLWRGKERKREKGEGGALCN